MPENNLRPSLLNKFPTYQDVLNEVDKKFVEAVKRDGIEEAEKLNKAREGLLRNYSELSLSELLRQKGLERARQIAREKNEQEQREYAQGLASLQDQFPELLGKITNVREVGPAGYQPGFQGGMDFANPEDMVVPPPSNKASDIVEASLNTGQRIARDQGLMSQAREGASSFFGGVGDFLTNPAVQRILEIMARPEFQDPEGISAGIVGAAYGLRQDEIKAAEKEMEKQKLANQARRQAFLDQMKIAEFGLSKERAEIAKRTEERIAGKPVTVKTPTKKEYTELENRFGLIQGIDDYLDKISSSWLARQFDGKAESKDTVKRRLIYAANELAVREGIPFEEAVKRAAGLSNTSAASDPFGDL